MSNPTFTDDTSATFTSDTSVTFPDDARRALQDRLRALPDEGTPELRARRLRSLLEELGIRCDETATLHDLDAVLLGSRRGMDALIASRLTDDERHIAYARLIARLLVGEMRAPLDAKMEYAPGHHGPSRRDREEEKLVLAVAHALADGRLDAAPRPLYQDVPKFAFAFTPRTAARSTLGGLHQWSILWYRRSGMYRRWRSRRDVSTAIARVVGALDHPTTLVAP